MASGDTPLRVIGLPQVHETLQQKRRGDDLADPYVVNRTETVPTLAEMSQVALNVLDNNRDGFFLMIEGGAVDWAGHDNQSGRLIEEEIDFNRAVEAVAAWIEKNSSWDDTLLIVTADHETGYLNGPGSTTPPLEKRSSIS
jgi:alkaline phosphatase